MINEKTITDFKRVMNITDNNNGLIFYALLLEEEKNVDKTTHSYKCQAGQKDVFIETERFFLHLNDEELTEFYKKYKQEHLSCARECPEVNFIDLSIMQDLIHLHKMMREFDNFDLACYGEIVKSYRENKKIAKELELTDSIVFERCKEIYSKQY